MLWLSNKKKQQHTTLKMVSRVLENDCFRHVALLMCIADYAASSLEIYVI
jgi:hypothetical protein